MRVRASIATSLLFCLASLATPGPFAAADEQYTCGESDLLFGCTKTDEKSRLRAGCAVHSNGRFFVSEWRTYDLETDEVIARVRTGNDGVALLDLPKHRFFVIEGELACADESGGHAIPYRFLVERTGKQGFKPHHYTPETLVATGNWNSETQLHYGSFRSRSLTGASASPAATASPR